MSSFWRRASFTGAMLFLVGNSLALAQEPANQPPPAVETSAVKLAPVTRQGEFVGTVIADQQVQLMARVEGFLDSVGFTEGSFIPAGHIAFEIEKDGYQAALDSAKAALESANAGLGGAQANLKNAEVTLTRQIELLRTANVSQSTVDQATATRDMASAQVDQSKAQISQAEANVKTAELNLSYTDIISPIAGRIGKMLVTPGNLVSPSTGTLATVVQTDPIRVQFSISDRDYLVVINALKPNDQGVLEQSENYKPMLRLSDGTIYESPGRIAFINNTIDSTTGTIAVFAEFPNPRLQLVPGQFVTVTVQSGQPTQLPIVPAAAVQQDRDGAFVFVLDEGNHAVVRRVTLGPRVGIDWSVTSGLANGEVIITNGIQKVRAGIVVTPTPAAPTPAATGN